MTEAAVLDRSGRSSAPRGEAASTRGLSHIASSGDIRAELSDARRSILHRQERDALAILAAQVEGAGGATAAQTHEELLIRADLLELALLKQSRAIDSLREELREQGRRLDDLAAALASGPAGREDDPRHINNLAARLEAMELWILRSAPN